jgi:hypothetical protein
MKYNCLVDFIRHDSAKSRAAYLSSVLGTLMLRPTYQPNGLSVKKEYHYAFFGVGNL